MAPLGFRSDKVNGNDHNDNNMFIELQSHKNKVGFAVVFSSSSSTSSPSKAIFAQVGHRPSNHCIKTPTRPQAQLKTATGFKHGHAQVLRASPAAASAAASSASTVRAARAAPGSRGETQNEIVPLPRARAVQQG